MSTEQVTFDELFGLPVAPAPAPAADLIGDQVPLTDEQRGAFAARDRLAEKLGANGQDINVIMEDLALRLMEGGIVVDIDIHRWTGMKRLLPKELGLNGKKTRSKAIRLGEKLLMPPTILKVLNSLTTQLRAHLDRHAIKTVWGQWLSATAYQEWRPRHDRLVEEYLEVGQSLADNLGQIRAGTGGTWGELRALYSEHARAVWCRLNHYPVTDSNMHSCPGYFVEDYVADILSYLPNADTIRESFCVETKLSYIPLPSMLEEDRLREKRLWEKAADERETDRKRLAAEEAMRADVRSHYIAEKKVMVDDFLGNLAGQIHSKVYDACTSSLVTMAKNQGRLLEPTIRQLQGLLDWSSTMAGLLDSNELDVALADLEAMIGRSAEVRSSIDVEAQLKNMGTVARSVLADLDITPRLKNTKVSLAARDAVLGISSRLSRGTVAKAREQLGTGDIEELLVVKARRGARARTIQEIPQI